MYVFECDEKKELANFQKHGVFFEKAVLVFLDADIIIFEDTRKDYGEQRFIALGQAEGRLLYVVYTRRGEYLRIISARKANKKEQRLYQNLSA